MKFLNAKILILPAIVLLAITSLSAQLELPRKSPKASTSYTIGFTDVKIHYSRPAVNDRTIWGELVPYDKIWRAGANEATTIEFTQDVIVENEELPAGKYSFFLIPQKEGNWTAIFNKKTDLWGAYGYLDTLDALRIEAITKTSNASQERLEYSIVDQGIDQGYIQIAWEKMRLYLRFFTPGVMDQALENIEKAVAEAPEDKQWGLYGQAADFLMTDEEYLEKAMEYANKSTELFDHSWNWWVKAQVQAKSGDYEGAVASAAKSKEVGAANEKDTFYESTQAMIEAKVAEWQNQ